jgi:cytochrome c-type biogenesis protein
MVWSRFFAPCMLPLAPGYLSYVTGLTGTNLTAAGNASTGATRTATRPSSRTPGAGGGRAGAVRGRVHRRVHPARLRRRAVRPHAAGARPRHPRHRRSVDCRARPRVAGVLPGLSRTWRISRLPKAGLAGAPLLGATFALSWTPCLSPTLRAVLGLAAVQGSAARGTLLAAAYSLGWGCRSSASAPACPACCICRGLSAGTGVWVTRLGGVLLVAGGLALATRRMDRVRQLASGHRRPRPDRHLTRKGGSGVNLGAVLLTGVLPGSVLLRRGPGRSRPLAAAQVPRNRHDHCCGAGRGRDAALWYVHRHWCQRRDPTQSLQPVGAASVSSAAGPVLRWPASCRCATADRATQYDGAAAAG